VLLASLVQSEDSKDVCDLGPVGSAGRRGRWGTPTLALRTGPELFSPLVQIEHSKDVGEFVSDGVSP